MDPASAAPATGSPASAAGVLPRIAAPLLFVMLGVVFASWAARIPAIRDALLLSPAQLGVALLCAGAGSVGAFPLAAWLVGHHGPRRASLWSGTLLLLVVTGLGWAPDLPTLMVLMVGFGVFETSFNVAINAVAARMEHSAGRSIMSRLHAWYCVGTFAGALLGSALAGARIGVGCTSPRWRWWPGRCWRSRAPRCRPTGPTPQARPGRLTLPRGPLFTLGVVCFCVAIAEGAITDWSGVYMRDALGAGEGTAPLAFAAFSALELAVRWVADPLKDRWGAQRIVAVGGIAAAAGVGPCGRGAQCTADHRRLRAGRRRHRRGVPVHLQRRRPPWGHRACRRRDDGLQRRADRPAGHRLRRAPVGPAGRDGGHRAGQHRNDAGRAASRLLV